MRYWTTLEKHRFKRHNRGASVGHSNWAVLSRCFQLGVTTETSTELLIFTKTSTDVPGFLFNLKISLARKPWIIELKIELLGELAAPDSGP